MRVIPYAPGMRLGIGVDSLSEEPRGMLTESVAASPSTGGQEVVTTLQMIETQESLMRETSLSVSAAVRYGLASVDARVDFATKQAVNDYSIHLLFKATVKNPPSYLASPRLTTEAAETYRRDPEEFRIRYGDCYIDELYSGGEMLGLFTLRTRDQSSQRELKMNLNASYGSMMGAGVKVSASFGEKLMEVAKNTDMSINVYMSGPRGLANPSDITGMMSIYQSFNAEVAEDGGVPIMVGLKDVATLGLPPATALVRQVRRDTIEQCGGRVLAAMGLRGNLQYILDNPHEFAETDLKPLQDALAEVNRVIPQLARRAEECNRDLNACNLEGIQPFQVVLPERLQSIDPIGTKLAQLQKRDHRAQPYFASVTRAPNEYFEDEKAKGRFYLVRNQPAGIFWSPKTDAHAVYGAIYQAYERLGMTRGTLGYPRSDEETLPAKNGGDGNHRVSYFENGALWWNAKTNEISEHLLDLGDVLMKLPQRKG